MDGVYGGGFGEEKEGGDAGFGAENKGEMGASLAPPMPTAGIVDGWGLE